MPGINKNLTPKLIEEVCIVIQETGFLGSAEDYIRKFYNKEFIELSVCEAEMLVNSLKDKKGCLFNTKEGGYL
jgi:hypothetical protein